MFDYVKPILKRKPDYVVLHMGTNITKELSSTKILDKFRKFINLESLSNTPACFKNPGNPSCIDLLFTNSKNNFEEALVIESGLSDFHKIVVSVLKSQFKKKYPKVIIYRNYKYFENEEFSNKLENELGKKRIINSNL